MAIRQADPELVAILENKASGNLRADVVAGKFDIVAPTEEQRVAAAKQAETQRLYDQRPFESGNLTDQMKLRMLSPELAAQEEQNAIKKSGRLAHAEKEQMQLQMQHREAQRASMRKGMLQAQGEEAMRIRRAQLIRAGQVRK